MEGTYDVTLGGKTMGKVQMVRQGLYWCFDCQCVLTGEVMLDLILQIDNRELKLGLMTPIGDSFTLNTKIPIKYLGQGRPVFVLKPRHPTMKEIFLPVKPEEPFAYLSRIESAYLASKGDVPGIILQENKTAFRN